MTGELPSCVYLCHTCVQVLHLLVITELVSPLSVAQWAKPLLIGHSACWADGLLLAAVQIQVWKEVFSMIGLAGML